MTPEAWAEKDRMERWSKECNTCFMGVSQMVSAIFAQPQETRQDEIPEPLFSAFQDAMVWAKEHFTGTPVTAPVKPAKAEATKSKSTTPQDDVHTMTFTNPGEFYTACNKHLKIPKSIVDKEIVGIDLTTEAGRKEAWAVVESIYGETPPDEEVGAKETDAAEKPGAIEPGDVPF